MEESRETLRFTIDGLNGEYEIEAWRDGAELHVSCTCGAGVRRQRCRHRDDLLNGLDDDVVGDSEADLRRLGELKLGARVVYVRPKSPPAGAAPTERRKKIPRTEQFGIVFDEDDYYARDWVFDVTAAFRPALDIVYSTLVDRERSKRARAVDRKARPVHRFAWTRGLPPTLSFERGQIFYDPHGPRDPRPDRIMPWGDALKILNRVVQVREAAPDAVGKGGGWVEFEIWHVQRAELGEGKRHRCSQAAFAEFLRTGVPPAAG